MSQLRGELEVVGVPEKLRAGILSCLSVAPTDRPDAVAAAALLFEACLAEPLVLTATADEVSGLTRRIRRAAQDDPVPVSQPPSVSWWPRAKNPSRRAVDALPWVGAAQVPGAVTPVLRHASPGPGTQSVKQRHDFRTVPPGLGAAQCVDARAQRFELRLSRGMRLIASWMAGSKRHHGDDPPTASRRPHGALLAGLLVVSVASISLGTWVALALQPADGSPAGQRQRATASSSGPSTAGSAANSIASTPPVTGPRQGSAGSLGNASAPGESAAMVVLRDPAGPDTRPQQLIQGLSMLRAQAMSATDEKQANRVAELLAVPGSNFATRQQQDLRTLRQAGAHYRGVELQVDEATLQRRSGPTAWISAQVSTGSYRVIASAGSRRVAQRSAQSLTYQVRWSQQRWRLAQVR